MLTYRFFISIMEGMVVMSHWIIIIGMVASMSGQAILVESSNPQSKIPAKVTKFGAIIGLIGWVLAGIGLII